MCEPTEPASPRYSADGQWMWTGDKWIPAFQSLDEQPPALSNLGDGASIKAIKTAIGLLALLVLFACVWLYDSGTQQRMQDETDRIKCERYELCY